MNLDPEVIAAGITALVTGIGVPAVFLQARAATKSAQAAREAAQATRDAGHAQAEAVYKAALDGARTDAQEQTEQWRREQRRDTWTEFLHHADHVEDLCTAKRHHVSADTTEKVSDAWQALRRSLAKLELVGPRDIAARAHDVTKTLGGLIDDHYFITVVKPVFERLNAMWAEAHPHFVLGPGEDWPTCPPDHRACLAQDALRAVWRLTSTARAKGIAEPVVEAEEAVDSGETDPRCCEEEPDERLRLLGEINGAYTDLIYTLDGVRGLPGLDDHVLMTRACLDPSEFYHQHESRGTAFSAAREAFLTAAQEEIIGTAS